MSDFARSIGPGTLIDTGARLLTPPLREIYALLVRVGVLTIDD
ncbi:Rv1535 domain-containing protein [Mycolicibacterium novocastrense]|nr:Rv1535 domain-containing protein [Mycolicibacterium novocastrense]UUO02931.1 Rv1535 domain-containing protein [Mycolicibacterium novocastrense]